MGTASSSPDMFGAETRTTGVSGWFHQRDGRQMGFSRVDAGVSPVTVAACQRRARLRVFRSRHVSLTMLGERDLRRNPTLAVAFIRRPKWSAIGRVAGPCAVSCRRRLPRLTRS